MDVEGVRWPIPQVNSLFLQQFQLDHLVEQLVIKWQRDRPGNLSLGNPSKLYIMFKTVRFQTLLLNRMRDLYHTQYIHSIFLAFVIMVLETLNLWRFIWTILAFYLLTLKMILSELLLTQQKSHLTIQVWLLWKHILSILNLNTTWPDNLRL